MAPQSDEEDGQSVASHPEKSADDQGDQRGQMEQMMAALQMLQAQVGAGGGDAASGERSPGLRGSAMSMDKHEKHKFKAEIL